MNNIVNIQTDNSNAPATEKLFTAAEVNHIVEERLARERGRTKSLKKLKDALSTLYEGGYFSKFSGDKNLSVADMAKILTQNAENLSFIPENDGKELVLSEFGIETEIPPEGGLPDLVNTACEQPQSHVPEWAYSPVLFDLFAAGKSLSEDELASEYARFVYTLEKSGYTPSVPGNTVYTNTPGNAVPAGIYQETVAKPLAYKTDHSAGASVNFPDTRRHIYNDIHENDSESDYLLQSRLRSTVADENHRRGGEINLTPRQKELARAGGMTFREYYDLLHSIPQKSIYKK